MEETEQTRRQQPGRCRKWKQWGLKSGVHWFRMCVQSSRPLISSLNKGTTALTEDRRLTGWRGTQVSAWMKQLPENRGYLEASKLMVRRPLAFSSAWPPECQQPALYSSRQKMEGHLCGGTGQPNNGNSES